MNPPIHFVRRRRCADCGRVPRRRPPVPEREQQTREKAMLRFAVSAMGFTLLQGEIVTLYTLGMGKSQIARLFGISRQTVHRTIEQVKAALR